MTSSNHLFHVAGGSLKPVRIHASEAFSKDLTNAGSAIAIANYLIRRFFQIAISWKPGSLDQMPRDLSITECSGHRAGFSWPIAGLPINLDAAGPTPIRGIPGTH